MEQSDIQQKFITHWGEMGTAWGVNRTVAQIHALLFIHGKPLNAETLADTLKVARSNVSTSLRELQSWGLVRSSQVLGDRRDFFESTSVVWELFRVVVKGRIEREFTPTTQMLQALCERPDFADEPPDAQDRLRATTELMDQLNRWSDEMLRLSPGTLIKVLSLGASIQKFVRG